MGEGVVQRRPTWAGVVTLLAVVIVLGLPAVRLWTIEQVSVLALLDGIRMPGPLPTLGLPLAHEPSWSHWATQVLGAVAIPLTFGLWMSRTPGSPARVAARAWATTVAAVVAGCLVHAVLASLLVPEGIVSFLLLVGGTLVIGAIAGAIIGLLTAGVSLAVATLSPWRHD